MGEGEGDQGEEGRGKGQADGGRGRVTALSSITLHALTKSDCLANTHVLFLPANDLYI